MILAISGSQSKTMMHSKDEESKIHSEEKKPNLTKLVKMLVLPEKDIKSLITLTFEMSKYLSKDMEEKKKDPEMNF